MKLQRGAATMKKTAREEGKKSKSFITTLRKVLEKKNWSFAA